jgi:quercetin dioxygenase-like cupin family protein
MARVLPDGVPAIPDSPLALSVAHVETAGRLAVGEEKRDTLVYVFERGGALELDTTVELRAGSAALVLAGERAELRAGDSGLAALVATVGPEADRHAPLGARELVATLDTAETSAATGARSFQILFGPQNGSTRATLFAGFVPPGRAPWHYHLYDEIVWIPEGPGRLHLGGAVEELGPGSAFRLRPREVHIVENTSAEETMTIVGIFTPAGSPSAAYLEPNVAAAYRFQG